MTAAQATEIRLSTRGLSLAAKVWGPADGVPTLALHGWLDNAASFDALAPLLPELRIVAVDLPGHGLSDWRAPGATYHFVDWIPDVADILAALGWGRCTLLGHSMGAGIASLYAGTVPEQVERLALLEGLGPLSSPEDDAPQRLAAYLDQRRRLAGRRPPPYPSQKAAAERLVHVVPNLTPEAAAVLVARGTGPVSDTASASGVTWRSDPRLRRSSPLRFTEGQVLAFLRRISAPALLVWATNGYAFDAETMEQRCQAVPGLERHRLDDGGHHAHLVDAPRVARVLREFLSRA